MVKSSDILVLGATGFTGRLIVRYLFHHPERSKFTFEIAARSDSKLNALVSELGLDDTVKLRQVDVTKFDQVEEAVKRVKVVINTVGPYWNWGTPVVRACVRHGIHYVDLAGETHWVREIMTEFDYSATQSRAIIIPGCGMDSIPSDLSVFISNKTLKSVAGPNASIESSTTGFKMRGGISGGTLSSAMSTVEDIPRDKFNRALDPYILSPVRGRPLPPSRTFYSLPHTPLKGGFFFMSSTNRALVEHTWALHELQLRKFSGKKHQVNIDGATREHAQSLSYGPEFVYDEFVITRSVFGALLWSLGFAVARFLVFYVYPVRWFIKRFGLQPGEGPSEKTMQNGFLETINVTSSVATSDTPQINVKTVTRGKGDPGYLLTSVMISESALSIVFSFKDLPHLGQRGGVLTPMSALGDVLVERLKASGSFEFESAVIPQKVSS